MLVKDSMASGT